MATEALADSEVTAADVGALGAAMPADICPDGDNNDVDRQLLDPVFGRAQGNMAYPPTRRHSDYFEDPYFQASVRRVVELAGRRYAATHLGADSPPPDELSAV